MGVSSLPASSSSSPPSLEERLKAVHPVNTQPHRPVPTQLHVQLGNFLASVVRSRTFYGTLADNICEEYPDKHCWNGERVGEYTKTVVDSSLTAQRYNPEFTVIGGSTTRLVSAYGNSNTSVLIDQLRHINQVVQSQLASAPDSGVLLADEALDGSGSGARPAWGKNDDGDIDDEDVGDNDDEEASGSGMGPTTTYSPGTNDPSKSNEVPSSSFPVIRLDFIVLLLSSLAVCGA